MMTPVALIDLKAVYQNGQVKMTWRFPPNAPETVHIYTVKSHTEQLKLNMQSHIVIDLCNCNGGHSFTYKNVAESDVKKVEFCVFLSSHNDMSPDARSLSKMDDCFVSVITGRADVEYQIVNKSCGNGLVRTQIILQSSTEIDSGILGYSYNYYGKELEVKLPGIIQRGITEYPFIILIDTADPVVKVVAGSNSDVYIVKKKISLWKRLLTRLLKRSRSR